MQTNPSDLEIHRTELKEYVRLDEAEESFLRKKSRLQWLNLGDKNSKFFFNSVKGFHSRNKILSIHNENRMCFIDVMEVKDTIVSHFQKILGGSNYEMVLDSSMLFGLSLEDYLIFKVYSSTLL
jgi:hypothetical protein